MSEYKLHVAIIDYLRGQKRKGNEVFPGNKPFPYLFVCHIFQGRSKEDGFFLKNLGVFPGVADILAIWKTNDGFDIGFIEVKTVKGALSTPQKKFKSICHWFGIKWALVRSAQETHDTLKSWGLECVSDSVREPDLRDEMQKRADVEATWGEKKYLTTEDMLNNILNPKWKP